MTVPAAPAPAPTPPPTSPAASTPDAASLAPLQFARHVRAFRAARYCELAEYLPPEDKALILSAHADGRSGAEIGALLGSTRQTVQRRLNRLRRRMLTPAFLFLAPRLHTLDPVLRAVAQVCFIEGHSLREAAARLRMTQHAVREARLALLALIAASSARPSANPGS